MQIDEEYTPEDIRAMQLALVRAMRALALADPLSSTLEEDLRSLEMAFEATLTKRA
jgi:hypothetical protein